jgi:hypothetical protein
MVAMKKIDIAALEAAAVNSREHADTPCYSEPFADRN